MALSPPFPFLGTFPSISQSQACDCFQFQYELAPACGMKMGWMSDKCLIKFLPHKPGECSENFQHKWEFYDGMFWGHHLFLWSEFRPLPLLPGILQPFPSCLPSFRPAHSIRLIFSRETLLESLSCFKTLKGSPYSLQSFAEYWGPFTI